MKKFIEAYFTVFLILGLALVACILIMLEEEVTKPSAGNNKSTQTREKDLFTDPVNKWNDLKQMQ